MPKNILSPQNKKMIKNILDDIFLRFNLSEKTNLYFISEKLKEEILKEVETEGFWGDKESWIENQDIVISDILMTLKESFLRTMENKSNVFLKNLSNDNQSKFKRKEHAVHIFWPYRNSYFVNKCDQSVSREHFLSPDIRNAFKDDFKLFFADNLLNIDLLKNKNESDLQVLLYKVSMVEKLFDTIISSLEVIEGIQIALFEKIKFVRETNYCMTLDKIPRELYPEILQNKNQIEEWLDLYKIEFLQKFKKIDIEFLNKYLSLVLDTKHFSQSFKDRLLSALDNIDDNLDGIIIHGDNFDGLGILQDFYRYNR
ncbi:MAG: hypothetical protein ACTSR2_03190 [Candidatus Hodarchaeales archaeon]